MRWRTLVLTLMLTAVSANAQWRYSKEIRLKKDVTEKIMVVGEGTQRLLNFRWTLYQNGRLVVLRSFDGFVAQNMLALNHKNQSFRVEFTSKSRKYGIISYALITFKAFDFEKHEAVFELFFRDDDKRFLLKYLNNKVDETADE